MTLHWDLPSLLRESLPEYVEVARIAINRAKPGYSATSCYGYPAAALLFSVADSIGSYYRGNLNFSVLVDNVQRRIDGGRHKHFFILNSALYRQSLTEREISAIYEYFRNPLTHNGALVPNVYLETGNTEGPVFHLDEDKIVECVNLTALLAITDSAVSEFLRIIDSVVPGSHQKTINEMKGPDVP
jgi:hypothetical protein